jgi:hypothetical protein
MKALLASFAELSLGTGYGLAQCLYCLFGLIEKLMRFGEGRKVVATKCQSMVRIRGIARNRRLLKER